MGLLANVPTLSYIQWKDVLVIYKGVTYQILNNHTCKPYIYWDAINNPYEFITSNKKLEERSELFYIIFNESGRYTIVPQTEIEITFSENPSLDEVTSKVLGYTTQINEQNQKITTMQIDVEGIKTTVTEVEKTANESINKVSSIEQTVDEISLEVKNVEKKQNEYAETDKLKNYFSSAILSLQSTLGLFSFDMNTYMQDNKIMDEEKNEIIAYEDALNLRKNELNTQIDLIIQYYADLEDTEKVNRLNASRDELNASLINLFNNINTAIADNTVTDLEIATIISYFGKANVEINECKNLVDDYIFLGVGGELIEELSKITLRQDEINLHVSSSYYNKTEVDDLFESIDTSGLLGIKSVDVVYYLSTSSSSLQGGEWNTSAPTWENGKYIWSKTITTYTDGSTTETDPICITVGEKGNDGLTYYTWIKYSDNANGDNMYDIPNSNTKYIGIAVNQVLELESNDPSDYTWSLIKGADGSNFYTWIRYADDNKGNGISDNPTGKLYIGFAYNKPSSTESNNPSDYTWSLIKGTDGINGKDGTPYFTWIKYSDNANGSNMYDIPNNDTKYIGIAVNKTTQAESSSPSDYTWSKFKGEDGTDGVSAVPYYTWIRYADDANGSGISNDPTGKLYIGFAYNKPSQTESNNPSDYKWSLIKGEDGVDGTSVKILGTYESEEELNNAHPSNNNNGDGYIIKGDLYVWTGVFFENVGKISGEDGKDGITLYTWIKYSDNADGSNMYETPTDKTEYIGIAVNKLTEVEGNNPSDYKWSKFKGADGVDGANYYTWIRYADDKNGNGISNDPTNKLYIGFAYNKTTQTESNNPSDYKWSLIKGTDGVNGEDGTNFYTWIKYSDNANGSNMYDIPTDKTEYIGIAVNKVSQTESSNPSDYVWSKFKGSDGVDGTNGKGVVGIVDYYKVHTSNTGVTNTTSGFSTSVPQMNSTNKYLWSYELISYTDDSVTKTSARVIGVYSEDGTDGKGIKSITEYYAVNNSNTSAPSSFSTNVPTMSESNRFLWNYELITYTDNTTTETKKRVIGVYGETGKTGKGVSSIVEQYYLSTSNTSQVGGSWVETPPSWVQGKYIWTRSKITYTDNTVEYTKPICDVSWDNKTEIETTKQTVADLTVNLENITSRVETTEKTITTVNNNVVNIDRRVATAEEKITDNAIINTVSSVYATKDSVTNLNTQLTQTSESLNFYIENSGGENLIKNSDFSAGIEKWDNNGTFTWYMPINGSEIPNTYGKMICIQGNSGVGIFQRFDTIVGQQYTVSFYAEGYQLKPIATEIGIEGIHSITLTSEPGFKRWSFTFTATATSHVFVAYLRASGRFYLGRVMVAKGATIQEYRKNTSEIYSSTVKVDIDGIEINSDNAGTTNRINTNGMIISDKATGMDLLKATKDGVVAKGGAFYVDDPNNGYTLFWGRDIEINGQRALVGTHATPETSLLPNKLYVNYLGDFINGTEITGSLTNNTFPILSDVGSSMNQVGYIKFSNGLILQWGSVQGLQISNGQVMDAYITFGIAFPNYVLSFIPNITIIDNDNYLSTRYNLIGRAISTSQALVYAVNHTSDKVGALMDICYIAIGC